MSFCVTLTRSPFGLRTIYSNAVVSAVACSMVEPAIPPTSAPPKAVTALAGPPMA